MPEYEIPTAELKQFVHPLDGQMWKCLPIHEDEIRIIENSSKNEDRVWDDLVNLLSHDDSRIFHVDRIATLARKPITGKIVLILENHSSPVKAYLYDGNHRVAAAYIRGDATVRLFVAASSPGRISDVFPGAVQVS